MRVHTHPPFEMGQTNIIKLRPQRETDGHTLSHFLNCALIPSGLSSDDFYQLLSLSDTDVEKGVITSTLVPLCPLKANKQKSPLVKGHWNMYLGYDPKPIRLPMKAPSTSLLVTGPTEAVDGGQPHVQTTRSKPQVPCSSSPNISARLAFLDHHIRGAGSSHTRRRLPFKSLLSPQPLHQPNPSP